MTTISIKYNPYLITTVINVNGQHPKQNSALNVGNKRLQEWVEKLPQIALEEYRDRNVKVEFTGTTSDFEDVKAAFDAYSGEVAAQIVFHKTADITDVERTINSIFESIQNGPVPELRDNKIIAAFQKAKDSQFEINVVATMSSGKSTLINALLQQELMPAANEATTATIVKIIDTDKDYFSAIAYDKSGQIVSKIDNVSLEDMKRLNSDIKVSMVEIRGKIPFVSSVGMKLVLVDTPGPNNSRDKRHEEMTYKMIADSDKSLVLYVMNGQQLGINDEKIFLDYVCQSMKEGGKQARERFIFAVNKLDVFSPKKEGEDCIQRALENVKSGLEGRGIYNPNIFPVTACAALELRIEEEESMYLGNFQRGIKKYNALHFEDYYQFSNLPQSVRNDVTGMLSKANKEGKEDVITEIHSGIISIEKAISLYINKYARTTKVSDLVLSFNEKLSELAAVAHLEDAIRKDKNTKAVLEEQISKIKANIQSAKNAQSRSQKIDQIDIITPVTSRLDDYFKTINTQVSKLQLGDRTVEKTKALQQCSNIEKECDAISLQLKVQIEKIIQDNYKETIDKIIEEYKKYLSELNMTVNSSELTFSPVSLVVASLGDLKSIVSNYTKTVDESYDKPVKDEIPIESNRIKRALKGAATGASTGAAAGTFVPLVGPFLGGIAGALIGAATGAATGHGNTTKPITRLNHVEKYVDYVDMSAVSKEYIQEFQERVLSIKGQTTTFIKEETKRLKDHLKNELVKIDNVLNDKLTALSKTESDSKAKAEEIAIKEKNLRWLEDIQTQINNIVNF